MRVLWRAALAAAVWLLAADAAIGRQAPDPKSRFIQELGRFGLALEGTFGDEGHVITSALEGMTRGLADWDTTIRTYEAAMAAEIGAADPPLAARMHLALGGVYLDRHRVDAALREFTAARTIDPNRADVHALIGLAYDQLANDQAAAADAFRTAASLDVSNPIRTYILARHLAQQGAHGESSEVVRRFLDNPAVRATIKNRTAVPLPFVRVDLVPERSGIEPFFPPLRYAEGFALLRRGEYERAVAAFKSAAARDPLVADAGPHREPLQRAADALRDGAIETTIAQLTTAIGLAADRAEPHRVLGRAYAIDGRHDQAIATLQQALRLDPRGERTRLALAEALVESGRLPEAGEHLRATVAALPESGRARYALARLYQRQGRYPDALREFQMAVEFHPLLGRNGIYETMGGLHAVQQNFDAAAAAYTARAALHPNEAEAHFDLGDIFLRQGRHDDALAEFTIALLLNPDHAKAAAAMAQTHLRNADHEAAVESARRALEIDATHSEARYVLGTALIRLGRADEGKRELEAFQRQQAESAAAHTRALEVDGLRRGAAVSAAEGKQEEVVAQLRQVVALDPSAASHLELGAALLDANRAAEAAEHFTAAAKLNASFEVHRYLAAAYKALGRAPDSEREQQEYDRLRREDIKRRGAGR